LNDFEILKDFSGKIFFASKKRQKIYYPLGKNFFKGFGRFGGGKLKHCMKENNMLR